MLSASFTSALSGAWASLRGVPALLRNATLALTLLLAISAAPLTKRKVALQLIGNYEGAVREELLKRSVEVVPYDQKFFDQYLACRDAKCRHRLGHALGLDAVLTGSVVNNSAEKDVAELTWLDMKSSTERKITDCTDSEAGDALILEAIVEDCLKLLDHKSPRKTDCGTTAGREAEQLKEYAKLITIIEGRLKSPRTLDEVRSDLRAVDFYSQLLKPADPSPELDRLQHLRNELHRIEAQEQNKFQQRHALPPGPVKP